jgi:hypothetical protein
MITSGAEIVDRCFITRHTQDRLAERFGVLVFETIATAKNAIRSGVPVGGQYEDEFLIFGTLPNGRDAYFVIVPDINQEGKRMWVCKSVLEHGHVTNNFEARRQKFNRHLKRKKGKSNGKGSNRRDRYA